MKFVAKGLMILLLVLVILIGGGLWFLDATLGSGMCQTTVFEQAVSSDGTLARVQMMDCGATTGFSRVVMVEKPGLWSRECRALALKGEPKVKIGWSDAGDLAIHHDAPSANIIARNDSCLGHDIQVSQER